MQQHNLFYCNEKYQAIIIELMQHQGSKRWKRLDTNEGIKDDHEDEKSNTANSGSSSSSSSSCVNTSNKVRTLETNPFSQCLLIWENLSKINFSSILPYQYINHLKNIHHLSNKVS